MKSLLKFFGPVFVVIAASHVPLVAHAHIKLTKPPSWLMEDGVGGPQKGGPCGPGGLDDVNPPPASGVVTTFQAGEEITVEWTETVPHPGHFRISLAEDRAELKDPAIEQDASCSYDESMVPNEASGNALADGVFFRPRAGFSEQSGKVFTYKVKLPDKPCEKCTLQVLQIMEADIQALSNCYYYHCADIKIVAAGGAAGAAGGAAGQSAGGTGAGAGAPTGGTSGGAGVSGAGGTLGGGGTLSMGGGGGTGGTSSSAGTGAGSSSIAGTGSAGVGAAPTAIAGRPSVPAAGASSPPVSTAGTGTTGSTSSPVTAAGTGPAATAAGSPAASAAKADSGGCSVAEVTDRSANSVGVACVFVLLGLRVFKRRRQMRA